MDEGSSSGKARLCVLYAVHACALGLWGVNFSNVLKAHGFEAIVPYAFACNSIAALLSPLAVGALADQRMAPERVLRLLGIGCIFFITLLFYGIQQRWSAGTILILAQLHALWSVPTFGLSTSLVLSRLRRAKEEFGPVRIWATVGWMSAGGVISWVLHADDSVVSGYAAAVGWAITVALTYTLPKQERLVLPKPRSSVKEILGLDALPLLAHPDHRVVFVSAAMLNMCLSAFYPFTVLHLEDLGVKQVTVMMSIGQITEIIAMYTLSSVLNRVRLKWVFLAGIGFGILRYALFMLDVTPAIVTGIFLHGLCFTLFFITAQIYLEQRIPPEMRARAQALLTLMMSGIGNLFGTLGTGWWRMSCQHEGHTNWTTFWAGMTAMTTVVFVFFAFAYQGRNRESPTESPVTEMLR
jgi:nucleoside transporter